MFLTFLQLFLVSFGLTYFVALAIAGMRVLSEARRQAALTRTASGQRPRGGAHRAPSSRAARRQATRYSAARRLWRRACGQLTTAEERVPRATVVLTPEDWQTYYLVPCLNEEVVIGRSVQLLLGDKRARVVVIDDASDDRTAELAAAADPDRVIVVRRELPDARKGKGPALNAGFATILADAAARHIPVGRIIVCVMDADGRLSPGAVDHVLPLFDDPQIGGVQLAVRIRNRGDGLLPRLQDALFLGLSAAFQLARVRCGTVSLGGNGQFTRLTALLSLERDPWRPSLTEDLDLSVALSAEGWRITTTAEAFVSQQGVTTLRALYNQWTRWYQGHMECATWIPRLWTSRRLSHVAMLEITLFLMVPWVLVLPWSILFHYTLVVMICRITDWGAFPAMGTDPFERAATLTVWYAVSFAPNWIVGYLYHRQDRRNGLLKCLLVGHGLLLVNYVAYAAAWRALYRMACGLHGWTKTSRSYEAADTVPVPEAVPASDAVPAAAAVPTPVIVVPAPRRSTETVGASTTRITPQERIGKHCADGGGTAARPRTSVGSSSRRDGRVGAHRARSSGPRAESLASSGAGKPAR